jgi:alkaline phosphatase D
MCFALFLVILCPILSVSANGIPSKEAFEAKSPEEFFRLEQELRQENLRKRHHVDALQRSSKSPAGGIERSFIEKSETILAKHFDDKPGFYHGVASGDPLPDSIILWTRYTPENEDDVVMLELRVTEVDPSIAVDSLFDINTNKHIKVAEIEVTKESDFIAKVDVIGLKSNTHYIFAFTHGLEVSEIGQTRTAPDHNDEVETMTYAFFSCSHFSNGYFHSYDVASTIEDLDFWVHVGDYIYEYGEYTSYASDAPERKAQTLVSCYNFHIVLALNLSSFMSIFLLHGWIYSAQMGDCRFTGL